MEATLNPYMSVPELARSLGVSPGHGYRLVRALRLPHVRHGRRLLVPRQALNAWLEREAARALAAAGDEASVR